MIYSIRPPPLASAEAYLLHLPPRSRAAIVRTRDARFAVPLSRLGVRKADAETLAATGGELARGIAAGLDLPGGLLSSVAHERRDLVFEVSPRAFAEMVLRNDPGPAAPAADGSSMQRVVIEYSSPNIAKPFHAGHLRSTIIGGYLARLYALHGHEVTRINYLGDWGKQFGLVGLGFSRFGSEDLLTTDPVKHLYDVYVRANAEAVGIEYLRA